MERPPLMEQTPESLQLSDGPAVPPPQVQAECDVFVGRRGNAIAEWIWNAVRAQISGAAKSEIPLRLLALVLHWRHRRRHWRRRWKMESWRWRHWGRKCWS
eukprot:5826455-Pyramimonas_sp.AAC.1